MLAAAAFLHHSAFRALLGGSVWEIMRVLVCIVPVWTLTLLVLGARACCFFLCFDGEDFSCPCLWGMCVVRGVSICAGSREGGRRRLGPGREGRRCITYGSEIPLFHPLALSVGQRARISTNFTLPARL